MTYCIVCGKKFVPIKNKNFCCSSCGWSCVDAIFRNKDKYDAETGKRLK